MGAAAKAAGLALAVAVGTPAEADAAAHSADLLVANAHRMTDTDLLQYLGTLHTPVLLYRGAAATVEEWLVAADYVLAGGNDQVVLCESGLRLFGSPTRTLDVSSLVAVRSRSHLPVLADATYGTGKPAKTAALTRAAAAAGAHGVMLDAFDAEVMAQTADHARRIAELVGDAAVSAGA
jgi:3-deoxy-D-arabino-heptulosonate 7-phosphate (DAHP) synthase